MSVLNRQKLFTIILALVLASTFFFENLSTGNAQTTQTISTTAMVNVAPARARINQTVQITLKLIPLPPLANDLYHNLQYIITKPDGATQSGGPFTTDEKAEYKFDFTPGQVGNYTIEFSYPGETFSSANTTYTQSKDTFNFTVLLLSEIPTIWILFFSIVMSASLTAGIFIVVWAAFKSLYKKRYSSLDTFGFSDIIRDSNLWPSIARFQTLLWTSLIAFCFLTITLARILSGVSIEPPLWPENLFILLGISAAVIPGSALISKNKYGETETKSDEGKVAENATPTPTIIGSNEELSANDIKNLKNNRGFWSMLEEDYKPSVTRFQMFTWTWIGILTYASIFLAKLTMFAALGPASSNTISEVLVLPDIDVALVALMGLSQGAYISGKAVAVKRITVYPGISPNPAIEGSKISIRGIHFGTEKGAVEIEGKKTNGTTINIDTKTFASDNISWGDTSIILTVPKLKDLPKTNDQTYKIRLFISGKKFMVPDDLKIERAAAIIESAPTEAVQGQKVIITGYNFYAKDRTSRLLLNNIEVDIDLWEDTMITFTIPSNFKPKDYDITIHVKQERTSAPNKIKITIPPAPDPPKIYPSISPNPAIEGSKISIRGINFGTQGTVKVGGNTIALDDVDWTDSLIIIKQLPKLSEFADKTTDNKVKISLIIDDTNYPAPEDLKIQESS